MSLLLAFRDCTVHAPWRGEVVVGEEGKKDYTVVQNLRSEDGTGATSNRVLYTSIIVDIRRWVRYCPTVPRTTLRSITEKCTSPHAGKHTLGLLCRSLSLSRPSHRPLPSLQTGAYRQLQRVALSPQRRRLPEQPTVQLSTAYRCTYHTTYTTFAKTRTVRMGPHCVHTSSKHVHRLKQRRAGAVDTLAGEEHATGNELRLVQTAPKQSVPSSVSMRSFLYRVLGWPKQLSGAHDSALLFDTMKGADFYLGQDVHVSTGTVRSHRSVNLKCTQTRQ